MSGMKKAIGGSIHRIREFELEKVMLFFLCLLLVLLHENRSQLDFPLSAWHFPKVLRDSLENKA